MAIPQCVGGTDFTATVTFKSSATPAVLTDPTVVTLCYRPGQNGEPVFSTYGVGDSPIVKSSTGVYTWLITTSATGPFGIWTVEGIGDGTVNVISTPGKIQVIPPSIAPPAD